MWRDLGIELLGQDGKTDLDVIKANNKDDVTNCCSNMLRLWLQRQTEASWNQLIEGLLQVKLNRVAKEIKKRLKSPTEHRENKTADTTEVMKITPSQPQTQQQDQAETIQGDLQGKSSKGMLSVLTGIQRPVPCIYSYHNIIQYYFY